MFVFDDTIMEKVIWLRFTKSFIHDWNLNISVVFINLHCFKESVLNLTHYVIMKNEDHKLTWTTKKSLKTFLQFEFNHSKNRYRKYTLDAYWYLVTDINFPSIKNTLPIKSRINIVNMTIKVWSTEKWNLHRWSTKLKELQVRYLHYCVLILVNMSY